MDWKVTSNPHVDSRNLSTSVGVSATYIRPFTDDWALASAIILILFLVFGTITNSIAIAVIKTSPRLRNQYYLCLASLCVSDIVSGLSSILFLYKQIWGFLFFHWPTFFCKLFWGLYFWTSFSTALHILSFALLRLMGVRWPLKYKGITAKHMKIWLFGIWFFTFIGGFIPHFIFNTVKDIDRENDSNQARWESCSIDPVYFPIWQFYAEVVYDLIFGFSSLAIFAISVAIALILKRRRFPTSFVATVSDSIAKDIDLHGTTTSFSQNTNGSNSGLREIANEAVKRRASGNRETAIQRRRRKDRQIVFQLFLIVCSFFIGYVPLIVYNFYTGFGIGSSNAHINVVEWRFAISQYLLLRFSECLNPVIYNLSSKKMRMETEKMLRKNFQSVSTCCQSTV